MAGDWIKFEITTSDKPEVWRIADELGIDPDAVVGKLLRVWAWFDSQTENGNAPSVTKSLLDRRVGVSGFVTAMISAGWMVESDGRIEIPNFDFHNGQTAKNRALTAKRVAKHKQGNAKANAKGNARSVTSALAREEKRREEDTHTHTVANNHKQLAEGFESEWSRWLEFRLSADGRRLDPVVADANLMELARRGPEKAKRDLEFSLFKGSKTILDSDNDFERQRKPALGERKQRKWA